MIGQVVFKGETMNAEGTWDEVRQSLRSEFGVDKFRSWFGQLELSGADEERVLLTAPNQFVRDHVASEFLGRIQKAWRSCSSSSVRVDIEVASRPAREMSRPDRSEARNEASTKIARVPDNGEFDLESCSGVLDERFTFDQFVVAKSNLIAHSAAQEVARGDGSESFNPLFLYGPTGCGKTHLMQAIAWELMRHAPSRRFIYMTAERFMYQFVRSLRGKNTLAFKDVFRSVDVLMIEDVHFLGNKESTQEEFFHTFNSLIEQRHQIILSADRSPNALELLGVQERIRTRLGNGLTTDIGPLDYELRLGILQNKLEFIEQRYPQISIPSDVLDLIASKVGNDGRELEGALNRLVAEIVFQQRPINVDTAEHVLGEQFFAPRRKVTIEAVQEAVGEYYGISREEFLSARRARAVARPRQIAMHLCKQMTTASLPEIGRKFGGRDHTTVLYAVRKIAELCKSDIRIAEDVDKLRKILGDRSD